MKPAKTTPNLLNITLPLDLLTSQIAKVAAVAERKTTLPILSHLLIEASEGNVTIAGTDLDTSVRVNFPSEAKSDGRVTMPAIRLLECLQKLQAEYSGSVTICEMENKWAVLTCGDVGGKFQGHSTSSFPTIPAMPENPMSLPADVLRTMITKVRPAIAEEKSRYTLNGALFEITSNKILMCATDGHRCSLIKRVMETGIAEQGRTIISRQGLDRLLALLPEDDSVLFAKGKEHLFFRIGETTLVTCALSGQFPQYESVFPKEPRTRILRCNRIELAAALAVVRQFADERSLGVRWVMTPSEVHLAASSEGIYSATQILPAEYVGEDLTISFNSTYVLDWLETVEGNIKASFQDEQTSGLFEPENLDGCEFQTVVMLMRM